MITTEVKIAVNGDLEAIEVLNDGEIVAVLDHKFEPGSQVCVSDLKGHVVMMGIHIHEFPMRRYPQVMAKLIEALGNIYNVENPPTTIGVLTFDVRPWRVDNHRVSVKIGTMCKFTFYTGKKLPWGMYFDDDTLRGTDIKLRRQTNQIGLDTLVDLIRESL